MKAELGWREVGGTKQKEDFSLYALLICLLHSRNVKKKFFFNYFQKQSKLLLNTCSRWPLPRSRSGQRPGGHFSADANSVQREVRSREKPEAAAPCATWDLHLRLGQGLSVSERARCGVPAPSAGRGQAGRCCAKRAEDWKPSKHLTPLHVHKLSLPVSPICAPASNLLLLHRTSLI